MGLFDRFKKKTPPEPAAEDVAIPELPALATIVELDADGLGTLRFDDDSTLRFGASACRGFAPIEGARVRVCAAAPRPYGGVRATEIEVADGAQAELDALYEARDRSLGFDPGADGTASAMMLGTVTVMFERPVENGRAALREAFERMGVLAEDVQLDHTPSPVLSIDGRSLQVFVGAGPLESDALDLRHLGGDAPTHGGFLSLSTGLASIDAAAPLILGAGPDPWGPNGAMRKLSKVVARLAAHGTHVVLHRAGHVVYTAEEWQRRAGDPDDETCRPFTAWIDVGFTPDRTRLATWGLDVAMRPDIVVAVEDPESDAAYRLAHDAMMLAAYRMTRDNRLPEAGDVLHVPPGLGVGPFPVEGGAAALVPDASCARFVARDEDTGAVFHLEAIGEPLDEVWERFVEEGGDPLGYVAYRTLLTAQLESVWRPVASLGRYDLPQPVPPFEVTVYDRGDDYAFVTCGLARVRQAGGSVEGDTAHVELLLPVSQHGPQLAAAFADFAMFLHGKGPDVPPWCPNDVVHFEDPIGPSRCFVLAYAGGVPLAEDATVTLLVPTPLEEDELEALRSAPNRGDWVSAHGARADVRARWVPS